MKIIDFERKGNVIRFYMGEDDLEDWNGDDWNDTPYECNAERVYDEFVIEAVDVAFGFDVLIAEPLYDSSCNGYCKNNLKNRKVPCIIIDEEEKFDTRSFNDLVKDDSTIKIYMGDDWETARTKIEDFTIGWMYQ